MRGGGSDIHVCGTHRMASSKRNDVDDVNANIPRITHTRTNTLIFKSMMCVCARVDWVTREYI